MKSLEQIQERALHASFTEVQQRHFDKLMSELEVISDGFGFAELKAKAEAGDKEALQVMRDYIAKKEKIVEFIETKEIPLGTNLEWKSYFIGVGDEGMVWHPGKPYHGKMCEVEEVTQEDSRGLLYKVKMLDNTPLWLFSDQLIKTDHVQQVLNGFITTLAVKSIFGLELHKHYQLDKSKRNPENIVGSRLQSLLDKEEVTSISITAVEHINNEPEQVRVHVEAELQTGELSSRKHNYMLYFPE
ncbi:hypothetical protein HN858_00885 [Candidatus Falkowbacteria bacterium]|jgi:hypothetical protein|nr:hypothetical protein [Candidatus Falkowbacteria bacterium]MBT6573972.1 hypothetical protein [Candidatus Falkowbacteria bacterium]MBT7348209.1 hypothetical protein [Candidatus Falkowbacteria bacterium]MBT7500188.1 hypothetical protein [Candidatus Falkowbacteria bacterium]